MRTSLSFIPRSEGAALIHFCLVDSSACVFLPVIHSLPNPIWANLIAVPSPIPLLAPVTTATISLEKQKVEEAIVDTI